MNPDGTVNHQPDLRSSPATPEIIDVRVVEEISSVPEPLGDVWDSGEITTPQTTASQLLAEIPMSTESAPDIAPATPMVSQIKKRTCFLQTPSSGSIFYTHAYCMLRKHSETLRNTRCLIY